MLILRRILFYLLLAVYLVFCPLTILYALGYIFKPGGEQGIVKSGLIYLSTAPPGASVYLGNRRYTKKTPTLLPDLLPGDYPVKLFFEKRKPWNQVVPVEAGKATVLEKILLLPAQWQRKELFSTPFEDLVPIVGSRFFLLTKGSQTKDFFVYDWKEEKIRPLLSVDSPNRPAKVLSYFLVPESPSLLLHIDCEEGEKFLWVSLRGKQAQAKDLTDLFPEKPHQVEWDPHEKKYLFSFQNGYLNRLDLVSRTMIPKFLGEVRSFGLFDKRMYVLREDHVFERMDFEGKKEKLLLNDPVLWRSLFGERGVYQIRIFSVDTILFLGEKGELLANRLPYRFVERGVLGLEFYRGLERMLLWKESALGVLDFSKERSGGDVFETGPRLVWVFKQGEKIEQAFWVYGGSHILFRDKDQVFLLELETYGKPHLDFLLQVKHKSSIFYSEESGTLYYLDSTSGHLSSMEILPKREILPLPFPERKEEKKKSEIGEL